MNIKALTFWRRQQTHLVSAISPPKEVLAPTHFPSAYTYCPCCSAGIDTKPGRHAGHIPRPQGAGQAALRHDRLQYIPAPLLRIRLLPPRLLPHRNNEEIMPKIPCRTHCEKRPLQTGLSVRLSIRLVLLSVCLQQKNLVTISWCILNNRV